MPFSDFINALIGGVPNQFGGAAIDPQMQEHMRRQAIQAVAGSLMNPVRLLPNGAGYVDFTSALGAGPQVVNELLPQARQMALENQDRERQRAFDALNRRVKEAQLRRVESEGEKANQLAEAEEHRLDINTERYNQLAEIIGRPQITRNQAFGMGDELVKSIRAMEDEIDERNQPEKPRQPARFQAIPDYLTGSVAVFDPNEGTIRGTESAFPPRPQDSGSGVTPNSYLSAVSREFNRLSSDFQWLLANTDVAYGKDPAEFRRRTVEEAKGRVDAMAAPGTLPGGPAVSGADEAARRMARLREAVRAMESEGLSDEEKVEKLRRSNVTEAEIAALGLI